MMAMVNVVVVSCVVLGCWSGCASRDASPTEQISVVEDGLIARAGVCALTLPFGTDASRFVLGANGSMQLGDRVRASDPIENMGNHGTQIGVDAQVGDIYSVSQITLRDRTTVNGSVFTTVPLSTTPASRVLGPVNTRSVLTPASTLSLPANFPASGDVDVLLEPDQSAQLAPGRYRNARVKSRATLSLRTGTYFFESFGVIEPQARVVLDERQGPVIIFVNDPITFRGVVQSNLGQPDWLIGVVGQGTVTIESSFQGTILAPLAAINLGTGELAHTGAFFARDVLAQPGTTFTRRTSSALSRCSTVLGGRRSQDLTSLEQALTFDPVTGRPFPGTFVHGIDQCLNMATEQTNDLPDAEGLATFRVVANSSCSTPLLFCDPDTGKVLSPQPTVAQLNAPPPAGSTCRAQPAVDRCLCPVSPTSLGAACNFNSDCPSGTVCATVCSGPGCSVPRRCGTYDAGCDGLPALANCQDLEICPDPESVGTVTLDDLKSALEPPTAPTLGSTPQPAQKPVDRFDSAAALIAAAKSGDSCVFLPVEAGLPVVDQGVENGTRQGEDSWGIRFTPTLSQKTASTTLEPFGVVIPSFNASAGLDIVATVFGQDIGSSRTRDRCASQST
jgi:hypothetical protein